MGIRSKVAVGVGALSLLVVVAYTVAGDQLPPRTALKVARVVSDLRITNEAEVVAFEDHWANLNGDGSSYVVLKLSEGAMRQLVAEATDKGYEPLVLDRLYSDQVKEAVQATAIGIARTTGDQESGTTVVLDTAGWRVIVHQYVS